MSNTEIVHERYDYNMNLAIRACVSFILFIGIGACVFVCLCACVYKCLFIFISV